MSDVSALLALGAAASYGTGDFIGGQGGRRCSPAQISMGVQGVGLIVAVVAVVIAARPIPEASILAWGALSGVGSAVGNVALYRGLARGAMNVVAPLSAVLTAVLPAVVGLATGDTLSGLGAVGLVMALPSVALVSFAGNSEGSRPAGARRLRQGTMWGLLAGCGFGLLFIALDRAGTGAGPWPLLPGQLVAFTLVLALTVPVYRRERKVDASNASWRIAAPWGIAAGVGGAGGNLLFLAATGSGQLTVVSVLTALYPAVTVGLAALVLHEVTTRIQLAGLLGSATAVTLIVIT